MINFLLALGVYVFLFVLLFVSVKAGFAFGRWRKHDTHSQLGIVKVAEGTVFALLGLLIAFSFASAYERFEIRKLKIIDEINAVEGAYDYVNLLKPELQASMLNEIKHYADERIISYKRMTEFNGFDTEEARLNDLQNMLWVKVIAAVNATNNTAATLLFIPAINNMFEIGNTRFLITRVHPPVPIFILLIGLAALSAFLTGYSMAKNKELNLIYALFFVAITAFTIYVIIDLEFPRMGMIRIDNFDHLFVEARDNLK